MRLVFVADGRSPIALNWIRYFVETGHEVHLVSTFPCSLELSLASVNVIPVAFGNLAGTGVTGDTVSGRRGLRRVIPIGLRTLTRQWMGPLTLADAARRLREVLARIQPDMIHAMRIPFEGMLSALAEPQQPLLISVWGNDFTLHAPSTPLMTRYTRLSLLRANALHADCQRDLKLARYWGFEMGKPAIVLPGGGGVQMDIFHPPVAQIEEIRATKGVPTVINPRGFRAYVRNDTFFQAIPIILQQHSPVKFVCATMQGESRAERWVKELDIAGYVDLLPKQTRPEMAELFRQAQVTTSITTHDGTPNTLLEALACGCFPIVGDIESLREWIMDGVNGFLVDPSDPKALAQAILTALDQDHLRANARQHNTRLIAEKAEYGQVMERAEMFYRELIVR
ncbi:MAG: glycosyltransferase family 4 protein [Anaerolineales bacterium]|nr:glycosyltransferase family 4 protein [Anaerolineales bacterium]